MNHSEAGEDVPDSGVPSKQPHVLTREEEIAFRKDWDARVVPSPGTGGIRHPSNVNSIIGTRPRNPEKSEG